MPATPDGPFTDPTQLPHELANKLPVVLARAELVQRRLVRDGFTDGRQARLDDGLGAIVRAAKAMRAVVERIPAEWAPTER